MSTRRPTHWQYLGRVPYSEANALQERIRDEIQAGEGPERLLLLTHPHVYTLGRNAQAKDVVQGRDWLEAHGVTVAETDRGGQVTYHGPGQLVGYPVIDLSPDRRDLRRFIHDLQGVLVKTLADFGVEARPRHDPEHIGIWVGGRKIASLGVHVKRWITTHGFALNVAPDLAYFTGIVPCGLGDVRMTSIERLTGEAPDLADVAGRVARHFAHVFDREMIPAEIRTPA